MTFADEDLFPLSALQHYILFQNHRKATVDEAVSIYGIRKGVKYRYDHVKTFHVNP